MTLYVQSDGENLIFKDYKDRTIKIKQDDYLYLIQDEFRRKIRPALNECFANPSEVWFNVEWVAI